MEAAVDDVLTGVVGHGNAAAESIGVPGRERGVEGAFDDARRFGGKGMKSVVKVCVNV